MESPHNFINYYEQVDENMSETVKTNIAKCVEQSQEEFDTFPFNARTPQFYILPKIHKNLDETLPLGYPGRLLYQHVSRILTTYQNMLTPFSNPICSHCLPT